MIAVELQTPFVRAVLDLVRSDRAEQQAEMLSENGNIFLTLGADGVLAALCAIYRGDYDFIARLEQMRIGLYDVRSQVDDPALVVQLLRPYLPFGGAGAVISPRAHSVLNDAQRHIAHIVAAYAVAPAWRVRCGIVEAFPAVFIESGLAIQVLAGVQAAEGDAGQMPWIASAMEYLARKQVGDQWQPNGLTGATKRASIRTPVAAIFTDDEITELSVYEYQECRSRATRAELLESNPALATDLALEYCALFAAHLRRRGSSDTAESYGSVARSLRHAKTGDLDDAAALVQDIGYLPVHVLVGRLAAALAADDLLAAANLCRHSLHLVDHHLAPLLWANTNLQLVGILAQSASRAAGTNSAIVEEIVLRCTAALRELDHGSPDWANAAVHLAEAMIERARGNRNTNLETAASILAEVVDAGIDDKGLAHAHLVLANAYRDHFGDSATESLRRGLDHAERALGTYEATGNMLGASIARLALAQLFVRAAGQVRGKTRVGLLEAAEQNLDRCTFVPQPPVSITESSAAAFAYMAQVNGIEDEVVQRLQTNLAEVRAPSEAYLLQVRAICKMLRYSDGEQDLSAHRAAVDLSSQVVASFDHTKQPLAWARAMFALSTMHTRYPQPTDEMLEDAQEAQRAALDVFRSENSKYEAGLTTMALGNVAFRRHRWDEAVPWFHDAISGFAEGEAWSMSDRGVLAQISELRDTYARLSYALFRSGCDVSECLEQLERGKTHLAAGRDGPPFVMGEVIQALPTGGAVVVPLITSEGSLVWIVTRGPTDSLVITTVELEPRVERDIDNVLHGSGSSTGWAAAYNALQESDDDAAFGTWAAAIESTCRELWQLVGQHIEAGLRDAGVSHGAPVAIAPSRQLSALPLHAAWRPDGHGGRHYLGDAYAITYTPGLRSLAAVSAGRRARAERTASLLAVGDPSDDLPHAVDEVNAVAGHFSPERRETLYGVDARRDRIRRAAANRTHLHIACHGSFDRDNPLQSSLHLADGPVRVDELRGLTPFAELDLITLSACETGLFDNTRTPYEWLGIAGALVRAGATDIICTLWKIDDEATVGFMDRFYDSLITDRIPPAHALRATQTVMRRAPELRHPFYWAAFIHVGTLQ